MHQRLTLEQILVNNEVCPGAQRWLNFRSFQIQLHLCFPVMLLTTFIINMKRKLRCSSKRVSKHAKDLTHRNTYPQPRNQRDSPVPEKDVNSLHVPDSQNGLMKLVIPRFNEIRGKMDFILPFMPTLTNADSEPAYITTDKKSGIHIASWKLICNKSDKSMLHTGGSNLSTAGETDHINNFNILTCNNLKRIFHRQQSLQHDFSSELRYGVLAKQSPKNRSQGPKTHEKCIENFVPISARGAAMARTIVGASHLERVVTARFRTKKIQERKKRTQPKE